MTEAVTESEESGGELKRLEKAFEDIKEGRTESNPETIRDMIQRKRERLESDA